jgi:hypothetical protein
MPANATPAGAPRLHADVRIGLCLWLLLGLAALCLWPAITGPFVFDDFPNLQNLAQLGGHVTPGSVGYYLYAFVDNPGRPLSALSFLIEDSTWPTFPAAFKRDNILFHLVAGCLVFWLALRLCRLSPRTAARAPLIALACAAMWLLQPMQLSTLMLVVQRMTILSAVFTLAGLLVYLRVLESTRLSDFGRVALAGIALALFAVVAILCKENGILIFAYASAINLTLLQPTIARLLPGNRRLLLWGCASPLLLLAALAAANAQSIVQTYAYRDFTLAQRLLTEPRILFDYLGTIVLPRLSGQGIFHDDYVVSRSLFQPVSTIFAVAGVLALAASALWLRRRHPLYAFGVLWFLAGHLLESSVVALELYFEHRNYLPMIGPLFALAAWLSTVRPAWLKAAALVLAVWIGTAALLTRYNAGIWGDAGKLALVWAQQSPSSMRAVQMLAGYQANTGDLAAARATLDAGIAHLPSQPDLKFQRVLLDCIDRGITREQWQRLLRTAASSPYSRGIPDSVSAFNRQLADGGCHGTLSRDEVRELIAVLLENPHYRSDDDSRGYLHYELARLALADHDLDALMHELDLSYRFRPNPLIPREQAIYLLTAGLPGPALEYLDRSDNAPQPLLKEWLLDIRAKNAPLRQSALKMQAALPEHGQR